MQFHQRATVRSRDGMKHNRPKSSWFGGMVNALVSDRARFVAFASFMLLVALAGGGSRPDIQSLIFLRPTAVLLLGYALIAANAGQLRAVAAPMLGIGLLMILALLQLVPLPATLWSDLPARAGVAEASALVGMEGLSRPLSMDPNRTWNTFFALFVPLAAIALAAIQAPPHRRQIVPLLVAVGLLSAVFGFLQAVSGGKLQLYDVAHQGYPTGLFANKNHQSIMLLWLMLAGSWLATTVDFRQRSPKAISGGAIALILVLFPLLILTGSRAGLLLTPFALLMSAWLLFRAQSTKEILRRAGRRAKAVASLAMLVIAVPLLFVFGVLALSGRRTALSYLFEADASEDLRWQYLPILLRMARDYLPFGSGFGSFANVFNSYEPAEMLTSRYMNQAHNDPLQIVIEGGLPALAIGLVLLVWTARRLWRLRRSARTDDRTMALFIGASLALWLAASFVDYPLRTPLAATLVAALTAQLALRSTRSKGADVDLSASTDT